jgi:hypothetical protein
MSNDKFQLNPDLHDASLEKVCEMANKLVTHYEDKRPLREVLINPEVVAFDLSYMLEYLRLNFDLVPKK